MKRQRAATLDLFAITAPGLEPVCAAELAALDIAAEVVDGGVQWRGDLASLYRANLWSRTASRVVARVGEFRARSFAELERHGARLPWGRYVPGGARVVLRVSTRKSRLYHSDAVAERIARALSAAVGASADTGRGVDDDDDVEAGAQLVIVRFMRDVCTISVDSSGALLHQRGYRQALAKAPLRETLAAALLLASGWRGTLPLVDPLCGSGTIPIEAALIARGIAPGLASAERRPRPYAFEKWPGYEAALWRELVDAARAAVRPSAGVPIVGSDRNAGALSAARSNAARAGVSADVVLEQRPLSALTAPAAAVSESASASSASVPPSASAAAGHLATNPPYGVRVGEARELRGLYAELGNVVRQRLGGWTVALLAAEPRLAAATALPLRELLSTRNGGIPVRMLAARPGE